MIIVQHEDVKYRSACFDDIKRNTILLDQSGECCRILEVVWDLVSSYMLIQHPEKRWTKTIPCQAIEQYYIQE